GLRLAMGARPRIVRRQLLRAAVVSFAVGGLLGVAFGAAIAVAVTTFVGWTILLEPRTALVAIVFAGIVGMLFGYYPARQAAAQQPVVALRSD
ncbi:MAG: FtsX-like permease family protein, partial [Proteobacteria bacterium]|nr:FtsX-like permease family protein [Pseudomonadota bacterium]